MKKTFPPIDSDEAAEALLAQDLSDYLHLGNFHAMKFEFLPKKINN